MTIDENQEGPSTPPLATMEFRFSSGVESVEKLTLAERRVDKLREQFPEAINNANDGTLWAACDDSVHAFCKVAQDIMMCVGGLDESSMSRAQAIVGQFIDFVTDEVPADLKAAKVTMPESLQIKIDGVVERCQKRVENLTRRQSSARGILQMANSWLGLDSTAIATEIGRPKKVK